AEVHATAAEGHVIVRRARDVEGVRIWEGVFVAVGAGVVEDDLVALLDRYTPHLGVLGGRAPEVVDRTAPAEHLLDGRVPEARVVAEALRLIRMLGERDE